MSYAGFGDTVGTWGSSGGTSTSVPSVQVDPLDPIGTLRRQAAAYYNVMNAAMAAGQQAAARAGIEAAKCDTKTRAKVATLIALVSASVNETNQAWAKVQTDPTSGSFPVLQKKIATLQSETNDLNSTLATCKGAPSGGYVKPIAPVAPLAPTVQQEKGFFDSIPTTAWYVAGAGVAALGAFWFVKKRKAAGKVS